MRHKKLFWVTLVLLLAGSAYVADPVGAQYRGRAGRGRAGANRMPAGVQASKLENGSMILADMKGMTLYTFMKDAECKSNCNGQCEKNWPPLMAAADAMPMGDWTIVTRDDGSKQWAYKGKPLYTWAKDTKPGETTGDGVGNGAWKIAMP
jgi:predicted lipoprotein with Yx(FWY)xxD motif